MKCEGHKVGGVLVVAGLLIGIGVGIIVGQVAAGTLIGLGVGFLGMFVVSAMHKK